MNEGGFSPALGAMVHKFNGGLFKPGADGDVGPLPVDEDMLNLLIMASGRDWADVEPGIFGTLLENALDSRQRGQLGAHFTPRAFVERLVLPTVMEPLRADWDGTKAATLVRADAGDRSGAACILREFHARLCAVRVLDPACGTANFLYVTLELIKRLEGEVLDLLADMSPGEGERLAVQGASVDPHQFLGLEKNPRAVPVAELVLWIGYLQWHFRTHGNVPPAEPILRDFRNIQRADALLTYDREEPDRDQRGKPMTRWGGRTKLHPVTGEDVPDVTDRVLAMRPIEPTVTRWPPADFIIGNPPFIAGKDLREELGDGYVKALWANYPEVPASADIALHWWWKAAQLVATGTTERFGFITSKSITQPFCRCVVSDMLTASKPIHLKFAIPNHPWADGKGTAAVRIAMSVGVAGRGPGALKIVTAECNVGSGTPDLVLTTTEGVINADMTLGADASSACALRANGGLSCPGVKLHGAGFIVSPTIARALGLGKVPGLDRHIRPYLNGRDLTGRSRGQMVIDLYGLSEADVRRRFPAVYQHVMLHVKPERDQNNRASYRDNWWVFGEPRKDLRPALRGLSRYIATVETAKHRSFVFLGAEVLADNMLVCIATDDAYDLGVLSSRIHVAWALAAGGRLGYGNDPRYNKTRCFDPFPFPVATPAQAEKIRSIAEDLNAHRKGRLAAHPQLTLTMLYNVLQKLRGDTRLTDVERDIHDAGEVTILREFHDRLDRIVADAYGWPTDLTTPMIVARVVALNAERRAEEQAGMVRWLRPAFQAPEEARRIHVQTAMAVEQKITATATPWPRGEAAQYVAVRAALASGAANQVDLVQRFQGTTRSKMRKMIETLVALGQVRPAGPGRYAA